MFIILLDNKKYINIDDFEDMKEWLRDYYTDQIDEGYFDMLEPPTPLYVYSDRGRVHYTVCVSQKVKVYTNTISFNYNYEVKIKVKELS